MIHLIIYLALIGFVVYLLTMYIPMAQPFKIVIYAIAAICVLFLLMNAFGLGDIPVPQMRR